MLNPSHREIKKEGLPLEDVSPQNTSKLYHNKTYLKIRGNMYLIEEEDLLNLKSLFLDLKYFMYHERYERVKLLIDDFIRIIDRKLEE